MEPRSRLLDQSIETAIVYSIACGVGCKVVDRQGNSYVEEKNAICGLVFHQDGDGKECRRSNLYGGYQAEQLGDYYVYFCPVGLANWAVPVLHKGVAEYYLIGGLCSSMRWIAFSWRACIGKILLSERGRMKCGKRCGAYLW